MHYFRWILIGLMASFLALPAQATRIKDIAKIQGIRDNQLIGYGLVVGLEGTGDKSSAFTEQSFKTMLEKFGISLPAGQSIDIKNVAAVAVSTKLPPFMKKGQAIDVTVSSIGSAKSLRGGSLLMTPLRGADNKIYAIAQGNLVVSGLGVAGADGSKIAINITSTARIPNGATVEREVRSPFHTASHIVFNLFQPDFTTAKRLVEAINQRIGQGTAKAIDSASVRVSVPKNPSQRVDFVSVLENIRVKTAEPAARVVINSRTGTIIIGQYVQVSPVAIDHGSLTVTVNEQKSVSQPNALAEGETEEVTNSTIQVREEKRKAFLFGGGTTLKDIVKTINAVGASPGDLMAILEALKSAGALQADLEVI